MKYSKKELDTLSKLYYIRFVSKYSLSNALYLVKEINKRLKSEKKRRKG